MVVRPDGRDFPPDIAKRKLAKLCAADGHTSDPKYLAGVQFTYPTGQAAGEER